MKKFLLISLALALTGTAAKAADTTTGLTIYGNSPQSWDMPIYYARNVSVPGYAVVSFARQAAFAAGLNSVIVSNVPSEIEPSSIMVKALGRNMQLVEQSYESAGLDMNEIISRNIGKEVEVEKYSGDGIVTIKGILIDSSNGLIIKDGDRLKVLKDYSAVSVADSSESSAGNTIKWLINSASSSDILFEYSYKTSGISWSANYDVYLDGVGADVMAKIVGWASLVNSTNINIADTGLKLVAGEVANDSAPNVYAARGMAKVAMAADMAESAPATSMQQQQFADYHMYTIDRKIDLPANSSKKIKLFEDKEGVLGAKKYLYEGANGDSGVKSVISFDNDGKSRLGVPLPGGKYRVFSKDTSGAFEQLGEVNQPHKSEGEKIELVVGNSFDLNAIRVQEDKEQDQLRRRGKYSVSVEITSALEQEVDVMVKEPIYQQNWQILSASHEYKKLDANTVEFKVPAHPKDKTKLEYIVQYSW
jgi:hypothetical protein